MSALYLHIPFCERKCSYCDFYSIESVGLITAFVPRLISEIQLRNSSDLGSAYLNNSRISSVFFGGGTPSLLTPQQLEHILAALQLHYSFAADCEFTMECNPGTVTLQKLRDYRSLGVNRLSFGVQSFVPAELAFLQRIHSPEQSAEAIQLARSAGFTNVNMDLMFALPPQTLKSMLFSAKCMTELQPNHISAYSLVYEHGTPLYAQLKKGLIKTHSEEQDAEMYAAMIEHLGAHGYEQYEVSNFAKYGYQCKHNLAYWHHDNYASFGPSAHGYINGFRYWNKKSLTAWSADIDAQVLPHANTEQLSQQQLLEEFVFLSLRADGIPLNTLLDKYSLDLVQVLQPQLTHWQHAGFFHDLPTHLRLTSEGYRVCDELTLKILEAIENRD